MSQANLYTDKANIQYLTNFTGSAGFVLKTKNHTYLYTDSRYSEGAKAYVKKGVKIFCSNGIWSDEKTTDRIWRKILNKHKIDTIGLEEHDLNVSKYKFLKKQFKGLKLKNISGELEKKRAEKTPEEIKLLFKSQDLNKKVFEIVKKRIIKHSKKLIKKILTEQDVAWWILELAREVGAEGVSFDTIVAFGENSAIPHHSPTNRALKKGDCVLIDMGLLYKGFCSDMTRTFFPWKPSKKQQEVYDIVEKAQKAGIKILKPGITGEKADAAARDIIKEAGYSDYFGHATGHGIGLEVHEWPSSSPNAKMKIPKNTVITVEPGIYLPGEFGVRIEDMVHVK